MNRHTNRGSVQPGSAWVQRARGRRYVGRGPMSMGRRGGGSRFGMLKVRLIIGLVVAGFAAFSYLTSAQYNEVTGEKQYLSMSAEQEIALGLQAMPQMMQQHGGEDRDSADQQRVDAVAARLLRETIAGSTEWNFDFHLLADPQTINAFALPGGQVFITRALYDRFSNDDQLAGVLGHEIGHVLARHSAQRMAKMNFGRGLIGAIGVASGSSGVAQTAQMVEQMLSMKFGRGDELQSDDLGVRLMLEAGFDPLALIDVMEILAEASGGRGASDFFSTHPSPENRVEMIREAIERYSGGSSRDGFPGGSSDF